MSIEVGSILQGKVTKITNFGAFVKLPDEKNGLVHVSEISTKFIKKVSDVLKVGDEINVKVVSVSNDGKIALSIKQILEPINSKKGFSHSKVRNIKVNNKVKNDQGFDTLMTSFLKSSEERLSSLRKNTEGKRGGRGGRRS